MRRDPPLLAAASKGKGGPSRLSSWQAGGRVEVGPSAVLGKSALQLDAIGEPRTLPPGFLPWPDCLHYTRDDPAFDALITVPGEYREPPFDSSGADGSNCWRANGEPEELGAVG